LSSRGERRKFISLVSGGDEGVFSRERDACYSLYGPGLVKKEENIRLTSYDREMGRCFQPWQRKKKDGKKGGKQERETLLRVGGLAEKK